MVTASPALRTIIDRWADRRQERQRADETRLEQVADGRQRLNDSVRAASQHHNSDVQELEALGEAGDARWGERLRLLDDWTKHITVLQDNMATVNTTQERYHWFDSLERKTLRWTLLFHRLCARYDRHREGLTLRIQEWLTLLKERENEFKAFQERQSEGPHPILVSRSRKQQDLAFVEAELENEKALGADLQTLRRGMTLYLGRLMRASKQMEDKAAAQPTLFELRRRTLEEQWKPVIDRWRLLREEILKDALVFESARRKLRWIKDAANSLRCVEDAFRKPPSFLHRLWNAFSIE